MIGFDAGKFFGPQIERAVVALETIAKAAEAMGEAAAVQQQMIQRALDASAELGEAPKLATVREMHPDDKKPRGKR